MEYYLTKNQNIMPLCKDLLIILKGKVLKRIGKVNNFQQQTDIIWINKVRRSASNFCL